MVKVAKVGMAWRNLNPSMTIPPCPEWLRPYEAPFSIYAHAPVDRAPAEITNTLHIIPPVGSAPQEGSRGARLKVWFGPGDAQTDAPNTMRVARCPQHTAYISASDTPCATTDCPTCCLEPPCRLILLNISKPHLPQKT
uniref:Uncharacterized protein n=1 Tax=Eutreptiella gymnastica TaxID=73025 RepID=A0A7S1HTP9_9EUGL